MTQQSPGAARPVIIGRSSSHFTRVARIFAAELEVDCDFQVVRDLMSMNPLDYGNNPALRLPALRERDGDRGQPFLHGRRLPSSSGTRWLTPHSNS